MLAVLLLTVFSFHWLFAGTSVGFLVSALLVMTSALPQGGSTRGRKRVAQDHPRRAHLSQDAAACRSAGCDSRGRGGQRDGDRQHRQAGAQLGMPAASALLATIAAIGLIAGLWKWPAVDPEAVEHDHSDLPPSHPHLGGQGAGPHWHPYVIDDLPWNGRAGTRNGICRGKRLLTVRGRSCGVVRTSAYSAPGR
jgi:hypothetical protein